MIVIFPALHLYFSLFSFSFYSISPQDQYHAVGGECTNFLFFCLFAQQIVNLCKYYFVAIISGLLKQLNKIKIKV